MKIVKKDEAPALTVRLRTSIKDLPSNLGSIYGEIAALFESDGIEYSGAPFVIYYNLDMDDLDIEAGFPVSGAGKDYGRVKRSFLPGGEQATAVHKGSYETIEDTYNKLNTFCEENNRKPQAKVYEEYLNSPEDTAPEDLLTNIYFLL